jgi:5-methylcytosine-specific restriction endonuclease McrA
MAKSRRKRQASLEWRFFRFIVLTLLWRLPRLVLRVFIRLIGLLAGLFSRRVEDAEPADSFYRSYKWRRLRVDTLETNRERYGMLACECCGMMGDGAFHVDHIYPRSTHPELALDPTNLQVLCEACNVGKGTAYTTNWRGGQGPELPKRRGLKRFFARS